MHQEPRFPGEHPGTVRRKPPPRPSMFNGDKLAMDGLRLGPHGDSTPGSPCPDVRSTGPEEEVPPFAVLSRQTSED